MSDFKIDKNIPITFEKNATRNKYPFKDLEIGDSFLVPVLNEQYSNKRSSLVTCVKHFEMKDNQNRKLAVRVSRKEKGIRIWRIE